MSVVILSEAKNLFVVGKTRPFAEFILSEAEGLRVIRRGFVRGS